MTLERDALLALLDGLDAASAKARALLAAIPVSAAIPVKPSDNFLAFLNAAPVGRVFALDPACVFDVPSLVLSKPVTIMSAVDPGPGRVTAGLVGPILCGDVTIAAPGVSLIGLRLEGNVREATILTTGPSTLVDRCVVLGSSMGQHRGICANSANVTISKSCIGNIWASIDTQAIAAWSGCSGLLVDDCYLESSGETVCFGGSDNASEALNPQDIVISNCSITKNPAWKTQAGITVKNLIELKNAQRVTIKGCTCSYSWLSGQDGYGLVLTVRNQDGGNPWANITDVVIEDCSFTHLGAGINILGTDYTHPSGRMANVTIQRCSFSDINPALWGGSGRQVNLAGGALNLSLLDTRFDGAGMNSALTFDNPALPFNGLTISGNRFLEGDYGIAGGPTVGLGKVVLDLYAPGYVWTANAIVKGPSGRSIVYPAGTLLA
jgi:hypothetical protein